MRSRNSSPAHLIDRRALVKTGAAIGVSIPALSSLQVYAQDAGFTFWYATNPSETEFAQTISEEWNASEDVQVRAQPVPEGTTSEEVMLAAIAAGTQPSVYANVNPSVVPQWKGAMVNLAERYEDAEAFLNERCGEDIVNQYRSADGGIHQVPWKVNPVMIFYNKRIFSDVGLDAENPPRTYSEALSAMATLKEAGITSIQPSIDQTWWERYFDWYPLYLAASEQLLLNEDATEAIFNNEHAVGVMNFWREVYENEYAPLATSEQDRFSMNEVAMRMTGPWAIPDMVAGEMLDDVGVMPVWVPDDAPETDGMPFTFADAKNLGIMSTEEDLDASWEFVKNYVSEENDVRFFELTQQIPLRLGLADSASDEFYEQYPQLRSFAAQAAYTLNLDNSERITEVFSALSLAYQSAAIYGQQSAEDALAEAESTVNELLSR